MADEIKHYITPGGFRRLQEELAHLWKVERPPVVTTVAWAAGNGDRSENGDYIYGKKRLREIDRRIRYLSKCLDRATVVDNADAYEQEGPLTTFFDRNGGGRLSSAFTVRVASFRTSRILEVRAVSALAQSSTSSATLSSTSSSSSNSSSAMWSLLLIGARGAALASSRPGS